MLDIRSAGALLVLALASACGASSDRGTTDGGGLRDGATDALRHSDRAAPSDGGSTCDAASCLAPNAATFVSQSIPSSVAPGSTFSVQVTMKNTGTATWTMKGTGKNDGYYLG